MTNDKLVVPQRCVSYFTSWGIIDTLDLNKLSPNVTHLILAFARMNSSFITEGTDNIIKYNEKVEPTDTYWIEPQYVKWTQLKYNRPDIKILIAYGGDSDWTTWGLLENEKNVDEFVKGLINVVNTKHPVYVKSSTTNMYEKVGYVTLDGVDFDFELQGSARPTANQLNNMAQVITKFKKLAPNKILSLTGYHVSADPVECVQPGTKEQGCSFPPGSAHAGELIPLLKLLSKSNLDFYQLMAYDAGKNYDWETAMKNHATYLPRESLTLGLTLGSQWCPDSTLTNESNKQPPKNRGSFVEDFDILLAKAQQQKELGYGGIMVWAIGAQGVPSDEGDKNNQIKKINKLADKII